MVIINNVDLLHSSVDRFGRDLSFFHQAVGQDLDLQESVLS
jgi:hypothetical protein